MELELYMARMSEHADAEAHRNSAVGLEWKAGTLYLSTGYLAQLEHIFSQHLNLDAKDVQEFN